MDYIPYATQSIEDEDVAAVISALRSDWLTQGPAVPAFEESFARVHDVRHAFAVTNATAGLHLACLALGVEPGQTVWTSPISFVASANCARYCGANVDFVDIDPITRNMSVEALEVKLERAEIEGRLPSVVIPVHLTGLPCDMPRIFELSRRYGFKIIEDAAHAVGSQLYGKPVGSQYSDVAVFSFHPVKIITTGEGGIVVTQDDQIAERLRLLRSHGVTRDIATLANSGAGHGDWYYEQHVLGFNYRMTDLQAALGASQLGRLEELHSKREDLASRYQRLLTHLPVKLPIVADKAVCSWHLYVVELSNAPKVRDRAFVFAHMRRARIGVNVHYIPIHLQPYYRALGFHAGMFPNAEAYYEGALSLPLFPRLTHDQQDRVVSELERALVK